MTTEKSTSPDLLTDQDWQQKQTQKKPKAKLYVKHAYTQNKAKQPKRNKSAFLIFSSQARAKLNSKGLNANEIFIKLGELWKNLPEEEKKIYQEEARKDKIRYYQELEVFWKENPHKTLKNRTKTNHVKKPSSAYALYLIDEKDEIKKKNPQMKMADVMKVVSSNWKALEQQKRAIYQERAQQEKEEVRKKLEEHCSKSSGSEIDLEQKRIRKQHLIRKQIKHASAAKARQEATSKPEQVKPDLKMDSVCQTSGSWPDLDLMDEYQVNEASMICADEAVAVVELQNEVDAINNDFIDSMIDFNNNDTTDCNLDVFKETHIE